MPEKLHVKNDPSGHEVTLQMGIGSFYRVVHQVADLLLTLQVTLLLKFILW